MAGALLFTVLALLVKESSGEDASSGQQTAITKCTTNLDIVFLIDSCEDLGPDNYHALVSFIAKLTQHHPVGNTKARYGAYNFGETVEKIFGLNDLKTNAAVSAKLLNSTFLGGTGSTNTALDTLLGLHVYTTPAGGRNNAKDILVVFFDGLSPDKQTTRDLVNRYAVASVRVIAVGIGPKVTPEGVVNAASSKDDAFIVPDIAALDNIEESLAAHLCSAGSYWVLGTGEM